MPVPEISNPTGALSADKLGDEVGLLMKAFFTQSEVSQAAGRAYRLKFRYIPR